MPPALVFFGLIVVVIVVAVVVTWRMERARTEALRRVAETAGLSFAPKADLDVVRSLGDVQLFGRGHSKRVTNLMTGRLGDQQVAVFDYGYTTGSGKNRNNTNQTVMVASNSVQKIYLPWVTQLHAATRGVELHAGELGRRVDGFRQGFQAEALRSIPHDDQTRLESCLQRGAGLQQQIHAFAPLQATHEKEIRPLADGCKELSCSCPRILAVSGISIIANGTAGRQKVSEEKRRSFGDQTD